MVSDGELGSQALSGDVTALAALLERRQPALYATAVGLLGNRADALDAVQDTFVIALLRLGDLRDPGAAGAWLRTVLRNACLARIRQRRETPSDGVDVPYAAPGPEEAFEEHALRDWVWRALDALSPEERLTLLLRHFSRCTKVACGGQWSGHSAGFEKSISRTVMSWLASTPTMRARTPTLIAPRSSADHSRIPHQWPAGSRTSTSGANRSW